MCGVGAISGSCPGAGGRGGCGEGLRTDMNPIFGWIESTDISEWVRGSDCICAFPTIVTVHNICMAFLAGGSIAIDLRLLGFAPFMPIKPLRGFMPLFWLAFAV